MPPTRWGTFTRYIPYSVIVGLAVGIALVVFVGQLKENLVLDAYKEPAALTPKLAAQWNAIETIHPTAIVVSILALAIIVGVERLRPDWPGILIAIAVCAALTALLHLDVAAIGTRFGDVPKRLPAPPRPWYPLFASCGERTRASLLLARGQMCGAR